MNVVPFPVAYADAAQAQRNAYADCLRSVRKTRDMWRKKEREAVFSKAGMALYAEATQRTAYLLRFHIRLVGPTK